MSYFIIRNSSDYGLRIKQFDTKENVIAYLDDYYEGCAMRFLDKIPENLDDFNLEDLLVIWGKVVEPKPITYVNTYTID